MKARVWGVLILALTWTIPSGGAAFSFLPGGFAPGEQILYQGRTFKAYRGMGSLGAMSKTQGSSDRYFQDASKGAEKLVPEGIEGRVPYKGPVAAIVHQLMGRVRSAMGYTGSVDIETMRTRPEFVRVTAAGMSESHVHDVSITKEAPNYPVR